MELSRRSVIGGAAGTAVLGLFGLAGCTSASSSSSSASGATAGSASIALSEKTWSYDAANDVYYQLGRTYVASPGAPDYETLGVYVPGKYFTGTKNGDGTYTTKVDASGKVGSYTAGTAPIVFPVNTPGYAAQQPPSSYSYNDVSDYIAAGFVYVAAGMRGKDTQTSAYSGNAPWGVTDLKAAVRFVRFNASVIPGSKDRMFVFGMSGGGAQSAVMGASGDSPLFKPYLESLGAAMTDAGGKTISDAVAGAMCWCPITSLDYANAAYEWNMGQFASTGTRASGTWTESYSKDLAKAYADHVNKLKLKSPAGATLALEASSGGQYLAGSYYDYLVSVVAKSLNDFLAATTFPYTPASSGGPGGGRGPAGGTLPAGATPPAGAGGAPAGSSSTASPTYATVADYLAHLNSGSQWVTYDASTKTVKVLSLQGFVTSQKTASKDVGAFDGVSRKVGENTVFGLGTDPLHFAAVSRDVIAANQAKYAALSGWDSAYAATEYTGDFAKTDGLGKDVAYRGNMYNPMYYLSDAFEGYKSSTVAPHWRIRTGIMQGDTANTVEVNLALALAAAGIDVDFATIWGQAHTQAELTGTASANFIAWVNESVA